MAPLNILNFGAVSGGKVDNITVLRNILVSAKKQQQDVLVPSGIFGYSDTLDLDGVTMFGADGAVLYAMNPERSAVFLRGTGAGLHTITLSGIVPTKRGTTRESCRVVALNAKNFGVTFVRVETCAGAGLRSDGSTDGTFADNIVRDTFADAIHLTAKSARLQVLRNVIERAGDDGVAVVSYQKDGGMVTEVTARLNVIRDNRGGRCMSVVGGSNIVYESNMMSNNQFGAGMYLAQENAWATYGAHKLAIRRNTILNCGSAAIDHSAVMIFSDDTLDMNSDVSLIRNVIQQDKGLDGIRVFKNNVGIVLDQNVISTTGKPYRINTPTQVTTTIYKEGPVGVE